MAAIFIASTFTQLEAIAITVTVTVTVSAAPTIWAGVSHSIV
jgi:hypothetical protein